MVTWSVDLVVPETMSLGHAAGRVDAVVLRQHEAALIGRARAAGWRMMVRPAQAAQLQVAGMEAASDADLLGDRRAALAARLARGRGWAVALAGGARARELAAAAGVSDTWVRQEARLARLDPGIVAELLRPGSIAAALDNRALRELSLRRSAEAQRALFEALVAQVRGKLAEGTVLGPPVRAGGKASFAFLLARARRWQARMAAGEGMAKIAASERLTRQVVWYWTQVLTLPAEILTALEQAEDLPRVTLARLVALAKLPGERAQVEAFQALCGRTEQRASA